MCFFDDILNLVESFNWNNSNADIKLISFLLKNIPKTNFNINSICILFKYKIFFGNIGKINSKNINKLPNLFLYEKQIKKHGNMFIYK